MSLKSSEQQALPPSQPKPDIHGSFGLNLLYSPADPRLELIFVHGLGGGSTKTWCYDEDISKFWPKEWLSHEAGFGNIRIYSYGYDSNWQSGGPSSYIDVVDFGRQLLERLRSSPHISSKNANPIVFVGHSMGGLVIKQAYVLARKDISTLDLAKRIKAMVFLGTPHKGSDLAKTLNKILRVMPGWTPRAFISNLDRQNQVLESLNTSFQPFAKDLVLWSFCESRPTDIKVSKEIIVPKESATLGYPNERSVMLDADHRHVCKFKDRSDPSYKSVIKVLQVTTNAIMARSDVRSRR
jgi:pimeloyl-ACP methyl ester carboxylesterase